ncbi:MAG: hypothetical protein KF802_02295 [Bdellovibrionaceae bacterium]|nr:hypothetical protein [Pseudobdellovibrionaceae bacterium]
MKWLKNLFKAEDMKGVAYKPLANKPLPQAPKDNPEPKAPVNLKTSPSKSMKSQDQMNQEERIELYKSLKHIPKPTIEFPAKPPNTDFQPVPQEILDCLNSVQRKLISTTQDYGFMVWKSRNPNKNTIAHGEVLAISAEIAGLKNDYDLAIKTGDYQAFPFTDLIQGEIRAKVLNTISSTDTEEKLLAEFFELLPTYASPEDVNIITTLIETARKELPKRSYQFSGSINGKDTSFTETRNDSLDLLALKELNSAMDDTTLAPLNLATGFFAKLTEFSDSVQGLMKYRQDFAGIIIKVEDGYIKEIRVAQVPRAGKVGVHGKDVKNGLSRYSPLLASVAMYLTHFLKVEVRDPEDGKTYINDDTVDIVGANFEKGKAKFYFPNTRYYAIVDGCVAGPNDFRYYGHQYLTANNTRIYAGEVFMFHMVEGVEDGKTKWLPRGTRIAFTPRDYAQVHPQLRTGGLVYGDQDMSYQSVPWFEQDIAEDVVNDYKDWWKEKVDGGNPHGDAFSPALVMARNLYFIKDENGNPTNQSDVFKTGNYPALGLVLASISEETQFTRDWWLDNSHLFHMFYTLDVRSEFNKNFYSHITMLNRHWNLTNYLKDGLGVTFEKQPTLVKNLCEKMQKAKEAKQLQFVLELYSGDTEASKAFRESFHKKRA